MGRISARAVATAPPFIPGMAKSSTTASTGCCRKTRMPVGPSGGGMDDVSFSLQNHFADLEAEDSSSIQRMAAPATHGTSSSFNLQTGHLELIHGYRYGHRAKGNFPDGKATQTVAFLPTSPVKTL